MSDAEGIRLGMVIMTHERRLLQAQRLKERHFPGADLVVDTDQPGIAGTLRTALHAWEIARLGKSHYIVIQDDVIPARSALRGILAALEYAPTAAQAFYVHWASWNGSACILGSLAAQRSVDTVPGEYFPTLAAALPTAEAQRFVEFGKTLSPEEWPDDEAFKAFCVTRGLKERIAIPNLFDHSDQGSLVGNDSHGPRRSPVFGEFSGDAVVESNETAEGGGTFPTVRSLPGIPFLYRGEPYGIYPPWPHSGAGGTSWMTDHWGRLAEELSITPGDIFRGYEGARSLLGKEITGQLQDLSVREVLSSIWIVGSLYGSVLGMLRVRPVLDSPVARLGICGLVRGGLARAIPLPWIDEHLEALCGFASAAVGQGLTLV